MAYVKGKLGLPPGEDHNSVDDIERSKTECTGRAYLYGLAVGPLTFSVVYFGQKYFTRGIRGLPTSAIIASSSFFSILNSYLIVNSKLDECAKTAKQHQAAEGRQKR